MDGFAVYHLHLADDIEDQSHSFPIAPSLTPVVDFQNVRRKYIGLPYTECRKSANINSYEKLGDFHDETYHNIYKENSCVFKVP